MATQTAAIKPEGFILVPAMKLPTEDGEPLESSWHRAEINLLIETLGIHWHNRQDFYAGGNMFVYYSFDEARKRRYRGPDFFVALGVDGSYGRGAWVVWEEGGKYPDVIVELLSESTANEDLTTKKAIYERIFRTPEYYCYDPETLVLRGWRLVGTSYTELERSSRGWLLSEQLGLWLGLWRGEYLRREATWLRFYDAEGELVPTTGEFETQRADQETQRADQEAQRADQEAQRADQEAQARHQAEAELVRLRQELEALRR